MLSYENIPSTTSAESVVTNSVETNSAPIIEGRPSWLPEKFKTAEDLANSYKSLESKLGGVFGAPEEYGWDFGDEEPSGAIIFKQVAKENNLSQQAFNSMVKSYMEKEKAIIDAQQKQIKEDIAVLGEERVEKVKNLIKGLALPDEQLQVIAKFVNSKKEFEVLENILNKIDTTVSTAVVNGSPTGNVHDVKSELDKIFGSKEWKTNPSRFMDRVKELYRAQGVEV